MLEHSYILMLNDGFHSTRRLGFTHTSQAFVAMLNDESKTPDRHPISIDNVEFDAVIGSNTKGKSE